MKKYIIYMLIISQILSCTPKRNFPKDLVGISIHKKDDYNYLMYIPTQNPELKSYPTIVYLHGASQRGVLPEKLLTKGLPYHIKDNPNFKFIVIAPQASYGGWWDPILLDDFLDSIIKTYPINKRKIYLTGYSMGGLGTWNLAAYNPKRFASIIPISGSGFVSDVNKLKTIPTWIFHGSNDKMIPIYEAQIMYDNLKKINKNIKLTTLVGKSHYIENEVYGNDIIYDWLLNNEK